MTMNISLTGEVAKFVKNKVQSGRYGSSGEVIEEALRLMGERERFIALHREDMGQKIASGMNSLLRGDSVDGEDVFDRLNADLDHSESTAGT